MKNGDEKWLILHAEIQGKGGGDLPSRMRHYESLIFAHYRKEPVALAIITDKRPLKEASSYSYSHYGTRLVYEYNNLVIMDLDDDYLLSSNNPIALAFYAAKSALRAKKEYERYNYLYTLAGLLANRGWNINDKRDLLLYIEQILNLKEETLIKQYWDYRQQLDKEGMIMYEHFLKKAEKEMAKQEGIEIGIEIGVGKGEEKKAREIAKNLLANGYPPDIIAQSAGLPIEQVHALMN